MAKVSEEFWDAIITTSTSGSIECEFCRRIHYSTEEPYNYDEGELKKLQTKKEKFPEKYIEHSENVHWGILNGKQAVYHCPCEGDFIASLEKLFWYNRRIIAEYFTKKAAKIEKESKLESTIAEAVNKAVDSPD